MIRITLSTPDAPPATQSFDQDAVLIGRSNDCNLPIRDTKASRMHCQLVKTSNGVEVIDLGSSNGTKVNGMPVRRQALKPGDQVEIGKTVIRLESGANAAMPKATPIPTGFEETPPAIPVGNLPAAAPVAKPAHKPSGGYKPPAHKIPRPSSARVQAVKPGSKIIPMITFLALLGLFLVPVYIFVIAPPDDASPGEGSSRLKSGDLSGGDSETDAFMKLDAEREAERKRKEEEYKRKAWERIQADKAQAERIAAEAARRDKRDEERSAKEKAAAEAAAKKAAQERAKRRAAEAELFKKEKKVYDALSPEIDALLGRLSFDTAGDRLREYQSKIKTEAATELAMMRADEIMAMRKAFEKMVKNLETGDEVEVNGRRLRVQKADMDGFTANVGSVRVTQKWSSMKPLDVYPLFDWVGINAEDRYGIGLLCFTMGLQEEGEYQLAQCVAEEPDRKMLLDIVVARVRGMAKPPGGFEIYQDMWLTPDEKKMVDQGMRRYDGKWMTEDEVNKAKGLVKVGNDWMTPEEAREKEKQDRLISKIAPKGYINKPGYYEGKPWSEAITIETQHYKIKSNLKKEAIQDAGYIMEWLYYNFCHVFRFNKRMQKFEVWIGGSKQDYMTHGAGNQRALGHCTSSGVISTFYQPPITLMVLMHEGTHQFIFRLAPTCPRWLHEGMATFFECSKFKVDVKRKMLVLQTGLLNKNRLMTIQRSLKGGSAAPLDQFVRGQAGDPYSQGWAFVYYAVNARKGMYARRWLDFLKDVGKGNDPMKWFRKWMGVRDLGKFEQEWKEYILALDPNAAEDQNIGHK